MQIDHIILINLSFYISKTDIRNLYAKVLYKHLWVNIKILGCWLLLVGLIKIRLEETFTGTLLLKKKI